MTARCFACGKPIAGVKHFVDTHEDQFPWVGPDCFKAIKRAGEAGYQPAKGGPRLWVVTPERQAYAIAKGLAGRIAAVKPTA